MKHTDILILGAGPAGFNAARAALKSGKKIVLAGDEPLPPYWRPRLPEVIRSGAAADTILMQSAEWFARSGIGFFPSRHAVSVDAAARTVAWEDGETTGYDSLILACGSVPNTPRLPAGQKGYTLRTYADAQKIRANCGSLGRAFLVGGGLLGLETAFALRMSGCSVTVADNMEYPLSRQLDREGGLFLKHLLEKKGLRILAGADVGSLEKEMEGACVVVSAGVHPDLTLAQSCGLKTGRGILVDERMQTSQPGIYACGDAAEFEGVCPGLITVAAKQGETAGLNAAGGDAVYRPVVPAPILKVAGISVLSIGRLSETEGTLAFRKTAEDSYAVAMVTGGRLTGAAFVGDTGPGMKFKKHVEARTEIGGVSSFDDLVSRLD